MSTRRRAPAVVPLSALKPLLKPVVDPVLERLDRSERLLLEMKAVLDVQFKRMAQIQAQVDMLTAKVSRRRK